VDRPCLEAFRTLFEQHSFVEGWTNPRDTQRARSKRAIKGERMVAAGC
jgi:hypothetical protein